MLVDIPKLGSLSAIIFALSWTLLSATHVTLKALDFNLVFPTEQALLDLVKLCPFQFAEGLLDVVQAAAPPTIEYFKSLPLIKGKFWAVYLLVLEKSGCRIKIYIGSGCSADKGYEKRVKTYDQSDAADSYYGLPHYVEKALKDGYSITHKATLAWTPLPLESEKSALKGLILLLETFFCLCF